MEENDLGRRQLVSECSSRATPLLRQLEMHGQQEAQRAIKATGGGQERTGERASASDGFAVISARLE